MCISSFNASFRRSTLSENNLSTAMALNTKVTGSTPPTHDVSVERWDSRGTGDHKASKDLVPRRSNLSVTVMFLLHVPEDDYTLRIVLLALLITTCLSHLNERTTRVDRERIFGSSATHTHWWRRVPAVN